MARAPRPPLLVIVGATGTGKTDLAAELARRLPGEVISADAWCVYRGLDIGTAKPAERLRREVPHHLVDCCDPREEYSVARFVTDAARAISDIAGRARVPIVAGGSGLHVRSLLRGLAPSPPPDAVLRARLAARESRRPGSLRALLSRLDPVSADRIPQGNVLRTARALEHRLATGRALSGDQREWQGADRWPALLIGLRLDRAERTARLLLRARGMVESGLLDETRRLLASGVPATARSLRALGYRQALAVLAGELPEAELADRVAIATRQFAKRQDTWFRAESGIEWQEAPRNADELSALAARVMLAWRSFKDDPRNPDHS